MSNRVRESQWKVFKCGDKGLCVGGACGPLCQLSTGQTHTDLDCDGLGALSSRPCQFPVQPVSPWVPASPELVFFLFVFFYSAFQLLDVSYRIMADQKERTFIAIKPDGVQRGLIGEIIKRFEQKGFKLVAMKMVHVSDLLVLSHGTVTVPGTF